MNKENALDGLSPILLTTIAKSAVAESIEENKIKKIYIIQNEKLGRIVQVVFDCEDKETQSTYYLGQYGVIDSDKMIQHQSDMYLPDLCYYKEFNPEDKVAYTWLKSLGIANKEDTINGRDFAYALKLAQDTILRVKHLQERIKLESNQSKEKDLLSENIRLIESSIRNSQQYVDETPIQ